MNDDVEYELKFMSHKPGALQQLFLNISKAYPGIRQRDVVVNTSYFDTKRLDYKINGYSLRYRPLNVGDGYKEKFELKAISGDINGFSARLEIQSVISAQTPSLTAYYNLQTNKNYPQGLIKPDFHDLDLQFVAHVPRTEYLFNLPLDKNLNAKIELSNDSIDYWMPVEQFSINRILLMKQNPALITVGSEEEIEFEIKNVLYNEQQTDITPDMVDRIRTIIQKGFTDPIGDIYIPEKGKALRGYGYVEAAVLACTVDISAFEMPQQRVLV